MKGNHCDFFFFFCYCRDKSQMPFTPIVSSVLCLMRYHLGTVVKGAFIITLVEIPRLILTYIHSQLKGKVSPATVSWSMFMSHHKHVILKVHYVIFFFSKLLTYVTMCLVASLNRESFSGYSAACVLWVWQRLVVKMRVKGWHGADKSWTSGESPIF